MSAPRLLETSHLRCAIHYQRTFQLNHLSSSLKGAFSEDIISNPGIQYNLEGRIDFNDQEFEALVAFRQGGEQDEQTNSRSLNVKVSR